MAGYVHFQVPPLPIQLMGAPATAWAIAYDIDTRRTQNDLGHGWNSHRCEYDMTSLTSFYPTPANTYNQLVTMLTTAGYNRSQYSDYLRPNADAVTTWRVMMGLMNLLPAWKMETTIKGLKMYTMERPHLQDVSARVRLGGEFAQVLRGPTPRVLVEAVDQDELEYVPETPLPLLPAKIYPTFTSGFESAQLVNCM
ncbi:hypothetical protein Clacol_002154 [Clathrus columnatus]|uniref:Uncharacterized protein n=1 Tax=Clathrus columnatus TaxID=1419009 RepID=A0AAV5A3C7_9AGAM|nr:hypothetical protein Clacol_002154 [Clathrus columnatus]